MNRREFMEEDKPASAQEDVISVVKGYLDAARARDIIRLGVGFAKDVVWHQPGNSSISGTYHGLGELFDLFLRLNDLSEGSFRIDSVDNIMANGDLVTATVQYSAKGDGAGISMTGVDAFRVKNGAITEVWVFSPEQDAEDSFWNRLNAKPLTPSR